jgi:hypothetical protein
VFENAELTNATKNATILKVDDSGKKPEELQPMGHLADVQPESTQLQNEILIMNTKNRNMLSLP